MFVNWISFFMLKRFVIENLKRKSQNQQNKILAKVTLFLNLSFLFHYLFYGNSLNLYYFKIFFWIENLEIQLAFQVHHILNELVMGGMVLETNMNEILLRIQEQEKLEKQEVNLHICNKKRKMYELCSCSVSYFYLKWYCLSLLYCKLIKVFVNVCMIFSYCELL